jgi:hypothetical protein
MDYYFIPDFIGQTAQEHFESWSLAQEAAEAVKAARLAVIKKIAIRAAVVSGVCASGVAVAWLWKSQRTKCLQTVGVDIK